MKTARNTSQAMWIVGLLSGLMAFAGCTTGPLAKGKSGQDLTSNGPNIVDVKSNPGTIELNRSLQPVGPSEVLAEVKDFTSNITEVTLRFIHVPLEVKMEHIGGTTWRAQLTPEQLKTLAVGGQTMRYEANVIAKNEEGQTATTSQPVQVAVKAPDMAQPTG